MCHNFAIVQKRVFYVIQFFVLNYDCRQDSVRIPAKYTVRINYWRISQKPDSEWFLPVGFRQGQCFTSHHFQRHYQNCESASTPQSGTSHKTCLRGFGGYGSIAWTSAVSHEGRTSNAFKIAMKLQTFLFQMVVTSCISVQYLWKYGFAKSSDNLYAPCTSSCFNHCNLIFNYKHAKSV